MPETVRTVRTLLVRVLAKVAPCPRCSHHMLWVLGLVPVHRPEAGEFVKVDQEGAAALARQILSGAGQDIVAGRLRPRPRGARGASFNPNVCSACGVQHDWYALDAVVEAAIYNGRDEIARGRIGVREWRAAVAAQATVICWVPAD